MPGAASVPSEKSLAMTWRTLQEREKIRTYLSKRTKGERWPCQYPSPEYVYYSVDNSRSEANRSKNRYSDILSYDRSTVMVGTGTYLNANVVLDPHGHWWVAAQAPMPHTHHDFFRAIQTRAASRSGVLPKPGHARVGKPSAIIVQLTNWMERGFLKADPYLPTGTSPADEKVFASKTDAPIRVRMTEKAERPEIGGTHSLLRVSTPTNEHDMDVHHYLFKQWPDYGVPEGQAIAALKELLKEVHARREHLGGQDACEVWVHCSAGIGRTGTFLALMSVNLPASGPLEPPSVPSPIGALPPPLNDDPIATAVDTMRDYRNHLVQTPEQLRLVYQLSAAWDEAKN